MSGALHLCSWGRLQIVGVGRLVVDQVSVRPESGGCVGWGMLPRTRPLVHNVCGVAVRRAIVHVDVLGQCPCSILLI